ncbi:disulfide bond formation protein B [Methylobacillus flagellatus]|uniref:disulfide bond formation protein B n=1 Tax=Methylobacillus flagellatus TaxID=405 RepID=UPI0010F8477A|nr:disulfide bond formation protein B [Methylobacillus flagellatus]
MPNQFFSGLFGGRRGYFMGFLASFGLVAYALFIQQKFNLEPCPLCIFQRMAYMALGVLFLLAALHNPASGGRKLHGVLQFIAAATGAGIALRHMWIQANPDKVMAECGAGFDYIFENFPLKNALDLVFKGTGECSAMDWSLFGLTIPQLSLIGFVGLGLFAVYLATLRTR